MLDSFQYTMVKQFYTLASKPENGLDGQTRAINALRGITDISVASNSFETTGLWHTHETSQDQLPSFLNHATT